MRRDDNEVKPILLVTVDGGPDENPRFPKTLAAWMKAFKKFDLDLLVVAAHAPGQSAFNTVERRMAPLSKELVGLILPYDTFGSHLNASRKTIDAELELRNFAAAGKVLAEVWHGTNIDGHPVFASYVEPVEQQQENESPTEAWRYNHVRQSQYTLQIRKCEDANCCKPRRSPNILKNGFLPAPVPFIKDVNGIFFS